MELSPQSVASTTFKTVKKGYDPDEVRAYLTQLASSIESTQTQAAAMEARARAAVSRLQELAAQPSQQPVAAASSPAQITVPRAAPDEAETISRTLLLAQRTADSTVAEAEAEAARLHDASTADAQRVLDAAHETRDRLIEEAKAEARRAGEGQRVQIESEVQSLLARREFLLSDVDHLEQHVITHRDRLREVAGALNGLVDNASGGLADLRRPLMSAVSDDDPAHAASDSASDVTVPIERFDTSVDGDASAPVAGSLAPLQNESTATEDAPTDATPPAGIDLSFGDVTSEVPLVSRSVDNDLFGIGGEDLKDQRR